MRKLAAVAAALMLLPVGVAGLAAGPTETGNGPSHLARAEIPGHLLEVYEAAAQTCQGLPWQILAAIGHVESRHGQGRVDPSTGNVDPPIIGPAIDGRPGFAAIPDPRSPDGWAHAVGPMQFLTTPFDRWGVLAPDRPPGASPDPHNAWDAAYSAARYLCGDRPQVGDLRAAVLRYNRSDAYWRDVLGKATDYGYGTEPAAGDLVPGSGDAVVAVAMTQLGVPYRWGGATPGGFDCSGLVQWTYHQLGINLPRTTAGQVTAGIPVTVDELRPGDLVFSRSTRAGGTVVERGHVAIYAGDGQVIVAPRTGDVVSLRPLRPDSVQAARRILTSTS